MNKKVIIGIAVVAVIAGVWYFKFRKPSSVAAVEPAPQTKPLLVTK
jgi:hypothetical protein